MQQITEVSLSERIVAHILHETAAVRESMGTTKIILRRIWKAFQQHGLQAVFPGKVDDLLMRKNRICGSWSAEGQNASGEDDCVASNFHRLSKRTITAICVRPQVPTCLRPGLQTCPAESQAGDAAGPQLAPAAARTLL